LEKRGRQGGSRAKPKEMSCCRDSSLYGRVQTMWQDLVLDLLKCSDLRGFRVFAFPHISRFRTFCIYHAFRISHISRISRSRVFRTFRISDSSRFCASHKLCTSRDPTQFAIRALTYLAGFASSRISRISHSRVFRVSTCATMRLPGIHRIPFACPVLILQGPLVRISLGFTRVISHMSLHSHLCSFISLCVYITSPLYV
jgi:hypothetical protein